MRVERREALRRPLSLGLGAWQGHGGVRLGADVRGHATLAKRHLRHLRAPVRLRCPGPSRPCAGHVAWACGRPAAHVVRVCARAPERRCRPAAARSLPAWHQLLRPVWRGAERVDAACGPRWLRLRLSGRDHRGPLERLGRPSPAQRQGLHHGAHRAHGRGRAHRPPSHIRLGLLHGIDDVQRAGLRPSRGVCGCDRAQRPAPELPADARRERPWAPGLQARLGAEGPRAQRGEGLTPARAGRRQEGVL